MWAARYDHNGETPSESRHESQPRQGTLTIRRVAAIRHSLHGIRPGFQPRDQADRFTGSLRCRTAAKEHGLMLN